MSASELHSLLKKLRSEINNINPTDKSSIEMLNGMKREIEKVLDRGEAVLNNENTTLLDKLESSVEHFEASHPDLTAKMNHVINFLNNLGL